MNVIRDTFKGVTTQHSLNQACNFMAFVFLVYLNNFNEALNYENWHLIKQ